MATWPASLPQTPLIDGYQEAFPDVRLRTVMDAGPAKMRRRYTAAVTPIECRMVLTAAQVATLKTFYDTTLTGGTASFSWSNPRTSSAVTFRFAEVPIVSRISGSIYYSAPLSLEIMPS